MQNNTNTCLFDLTSRKSSVTAESLESYKDLVKTTTDDLEGHLESINEKLESIFRRVVSESDEDASELQLIKEERLSTQKCLQICAQLSDHIDQIQVTPQDSDITPRSINAGALPERVVNEGLQECKNSLTLASTKLERHMRDTIDRLMTKSKTVMTSKEEVADLIRLWEEWETALKCRDICSQADSHLNENVSIIENEGTGDAWQYVVSTNGKTIHGKNRGLGWRSRQVAGHLGDASLQKISRDMSSTILQSTENDSRSLGGNTSPVRDGVVENGATSEFRDRYGPGFRLTPKSTLDAGQSSLGSVESRPVESTKY
jgi:hypothetical protein